MAKRKKTSTVVPQIAGDFKDVVRAMLKTLPPPPGDPSTRKKKPKKAQKKKVRK